MKQIIAFILLCVAGPVLAMAPKPVQTAPAYSSAEYDALKASHDAVFTAAKAQPNFDLTSFSQAYDYTVLSRNRATYEANKARYDAERSRVCASLGC